MRCVEIALAREDPRYPRALRGTPGAPQTLYVAGGGDLAALLAQPTVAIVGTRAATDYGMELARSLGRGLAAARVTLVAGLAEGIPAGALQGAAQIDAPTVTVMPGGLDVVTPASRADLYRRLLRTGCAASGQPRGAPARAWSYPARDRLLVALARLLVVVEAEEGSRPHAAAQLAQTLGRSVAAVPGRVGSRAASGPHALLREGATLVRDTRDVLDALYGVGGIIANGVPGVDGNSGAAHSMGRPEGRCETTGGTELTRPLRELLGRVADGRDTAAKLAAAGADLRGTLVALTELELAGALVRGEGGRYVPGRR